MKVSAHDVARELRRRIPDAGAVKVHKLLYYAQGWHLAWTGEPMFSEAIEAWANGPVVAALWKDDKRGATPRAAPVGGEASSVIDYVVSRYGHLSGRELIQLTHAEDPWRDISEDELVLAQSPEIPTSVLTAFFRADPAFQARQRDVERMRRSGAYSLTRPRSTPGLRSAIDRAATAPFIDSRPA